MKQEKIEETLIWKGSLTWIRSIMVVTCSLIVVIIFASVCMRYIAKSDLRAIDELITLVAMWLYFISAAYGSYENSHIRADLISMRIKNPKYLSIYQIVIKSISIAILGILVYWAILFAIWSFNAGGKSSIWKIPLFASQIPITIGFFLMLLYNIYHLVRAVKVPNNSKEE